MALLIRTTHQAEMMREEIMTLQPEELASHLPLARTGDLGHGDLRVVVTDPPRHATEELEGSPMPFQKSLGAFAGKQLNEDGVAVGQRHHEHRHAGRLTPQHHVRLTEIHLGFSRRMRQRQEHLLVPLVPCPHDLLDARVTAGVLVLGPQPLEDPLGRVPLLRMYLLVATEDLVDDRHELADLRLPGRFLPLVLRRLRRGQDPLERVPMDLVLLASRPLAQLAGQNLTSNLNPFLHVAKHPFCSSLWGDGLVVTAQLSVTIRNQERLRALRFLTALRSPPRATLFLRPLHRPGFPVHSARDRPLAGHFPFDPLRIGYHGGRTAPVPGCSHPKGTGNAGRGDGSVPGSSLSDGRGRRRCSVSTSLPWIGKCAGTHDVRFGAGPGHSRRWSHHPHQQIVWPARIRGDVHFHGSGAARCGRPVWSVCDDARRAPSCIRSVSGKSSGCGAKPPSVREFP